MPYYYAGHCEKCCLTIKSGRHYCNGSQHYYEANLGLYNTDEILEVKLSIIRHEYVTGHKQYMLMENFERDGLFTMIDEYRYKPITMTQRERDDLEYIISLQEQCRHRDYLKLEQKVKTKIG